MPERTCSIDGCCRPLSARGMCGTHYTRWRKHGDPLVVKHKHDANGLDRRARKDCLQCGETFGPPPRYSHAQWAQRRFCCGPCKNRWTARQQRPLLKTQRLWAAAWERQRVLQDNADLSAWADRQERRQRKVRRATKPLPRPRFLTAGYCHGCSAAWVDYTARQPSGYCNRCQDRRWAADSRHKRRAWKAAANVVEVISPDVVFKRDGHRCQICKCKTQGTVPDLRAPTVDHIVPLALGGDHSYLNVQCACFGCNSRKGARGTGDQLRLVA